MPLETRVWLSHDWHDEEPRVSSAVLGECDFVFKLTQFIYPVKHRGIRSWLIRKTHHHWAPSVALMWWVITKQLSRKHLTLYARIWRWIPQELSQGKVNNVYTKLRKTTLTKPTTLMRKTLTCLCGNISGTLLGLHQSWILPPTKRHQTHWYLCPTPTKH